MPKEIFEIANGNATGSRNAALQAFRVFGEALGNSVANMLTLIDGIVVIGGGLASAWDLFAPAMFAEIHRCYETPFGEKYERVSGKVYNLEEEQTFGEFASGFIRTIPLPGSERTITYDELQRNGVGLSKLSASKAIAIGANAFAVQAMGPAAKRS